MSNYSSSIGGPRSPLFGTATFSTLSPTQTPYSSSNLSYTERSVTPIGSNTGSEISSPRQMRRIVVSPSPDDDSDGYSEENSIDDIREVEATLSMVDDEIAHTEDALTEWSRGSGSVVTSSSSYTGQYSAVTSATPSSYISEGYRTMTDALLDRERRVLSTISERTEERSRPNSFAQSGSTPGSRPVTQYANPAGNRASGYLDDRTSPALHTRSATDPNGTPGHASGRVLNVPGRRAGELIAFFEEKQTTGRESPRLFGHTRTLSAPMGPRSPAPRSPGPRSPSPYTTTMSQSMSTFGHTASTSYGYGSSTYGYSSRPSSPTKSRAGSSVSSSGPITTMSSFMSPTARGTTLSTDSRFQPTSTDTYTHTRSGSGSGTYTNGTTTSGTYTNTFTGFTTTATPTAGSSLRRPQTSPRSPLTSVRNIVAAWKERTPSLSKSVRSGTTSPEPTQQGDGLFSLRRRADRGGARLRDRALGAVDETGRPRETESAYDAGASTSGDITLSTSGVLPATFDIAELGQYANAGATQEPLRIGLLWYLNVHAPPPYRWQRCQALLYPHMLLLSWIAPGGGRGIVTLDLLNCIEVRSVPSPQHPTAQDDVGTIAARIQSEQAEAMGGDIGEMSLMETLCPFQLMYSDGIERLGAESARERVRWVSAIWEVLDRAITIPDRSSTRSPTGSIRTIQSMTSTASSQSGTGSASTVYVPPLDEMSDIQSLSGSSSLSRRPSLASAHHTRATDDGAVSSQGYLYPGDPRVIAPSRSSSLRRTSSLTDLDEEFASALRRARESRPGLGFGLGLAGGIPIGEGSPVTISSGPNLGRPVYMSPPPSVGRGSDKKSRGSETSSSVTDDAFFSASSAPTSSYYSSSSFTRALTGTETRTGTGLLTDESIEITSGSGTQIVQSTLSYRGTDSASHLGDSHTGITSSSGLSPSRSGLTRSGGVRRRTPRTSRSYTTTSHPTDSEEYSDKENTYSGTYTYSLSTLESYSRTGTTPTVSMPRSRSVTPTPSTTSYTRSSLEDPFSRGETEPETDATTYYTAPTPTPRSPSTASFKSLSSIPSMSDYETALICETEYETAPKCPSEVAETEFETAVVCQTPAPTEFITAEVCPSEVSTDFRTAECRCKDKVPEADEISITAPSEIPTIPSSLPSPVERDIELDAADIPLPPSTYTPSEPSESSEHTPTERALSPTDLTPTSVTESSLDITPSEPSFEEPSIPTPSTVELSSAESFTESIPGPSPIQPLSDFEPTITLSTITTPTESEVTPTPSSQLTPTVPSTISQPETPTSPAIPGSAWGQESDRSYESSLLRASPSMASQALPEGPDTSFETSFLRPSGTPPTSEESSMLTPITEVSPSSPATEPSPPSSELTPTQSTMSLLPSAVSPAPAQREFIPAVTLSRTPSTISTVSSVSMSSSRIAPSEFELDMRTEPSLLSTPSSEPIRLPDQGPTRPPSAVPLFVPLPPSPSPSTPSASFQVSITTPRGDVPSIASNLETIASDAPSHILTHDVNRLLQYLNDVNDVRGAENKEMADNIQDIKGTLEDLEALLRDRMFAEMPPPVPHKDMSVGGSSVISSSHSARSRGMISERSTPAGPRQGPRIVRAISLSPPPIRVPLSPETLSDSMSFLSSHHSDDMSLMESVSYPMAIPASPSWPSSSPVSSPESSTSSSPTSAPPSSVTPSEELSDIGLAHLAVPPRRLTASRSPTATPPPLSSSPSPSSVSTSTVRPVPPINIAALRDDLAGIRQQIADMLDVQNAANRRLEEIRDQPRQPMPIPMPAPADRWDEFADRLQGIEDNLRRLMDRARAQPRVEEEAPSESDAQSLWERLAQGLARGQEDTGEPTIHAPVPRQPGTSFDDQLLEIMLTQPPPAQGQVQPPPPLVNLVYRPTQRPRPRSASPVYESDLPPRAGTVPIPPPPVPRERTTRRAGVPPPVRRHRDPMRHAGSASVAPTETESQAEGTIMPGQPADVGAPPIRPQSGPDIDFDARVRDQRRRRQPGTDGFFHTETDAPTRPPTAPAVVPQEGGESWYRPQPGQEQAQFDGQMPVPPPGTTFPQAPQQQPQPQFIPVAPGPTVVQLPPAFNDILALLRDNREGQLAGFEQQREIIDYLRNLNAWLDRDVHDRHAELQSVSARLEQTRDEVIPLLNQIAQAIRPQVPGVQGVAQQPQGGPAGGTFVIPPVVPPPPHMHSGPGQGAMQGGVFPHVQTPSPSEGPVIPPPPGQYYAPYPPVIPPGTYPQPPMPQPMPQNIIIHDRSDDSDFVPPRPSPRSGSRSSSSRTGSSDGDREHYTILPPPAEPQPPITIVPPPDRMYPVPGTGPTTIVVPQSGPPSTRPGSPSQHTAYDGPRTPSSERHRADDQRVSSPHDQRASSPQSVHVYVHPGETSSGVAADAGHPGTIAVMPPQHAHEVPQQAEQRMTAGQAGPSHPGSPTPIIIQPPAQYPPYPGGMVPMPPMGGQVPQVVVAPSGRSSPTAVEPVVVNVPPPRSGTRSTRSSRRHTHYRRSRSRSSSPRTQHELPPIQIHRSHSHSRSRSRSPSPRLHDQPQTIVVAPQGGVPTSIHPFDRPPSAIRVVSPPGTHEQGPTIIHVPSERPHSSQGRSRSPHDRRRPRSRSSDYDDHGRRRPGPSYFDSRHPSDYDLPRRRTHDPRDEEYDRYRPRRYDRDDGRRYRYSRSPTGRHRRSPSPSHEDRPEHSSSSRRHGRGRSPSYEDDGSPRRPRRRRRSPYYEDEGSPRRTRRARPRSPYYEDEGSPHRHGRHAIREGDPDHPPSRTHTRHGVHSAPRSRSHSPTRSPRPMSRSPTRYEREEGIRPSHVGSRRPSSRDSDRRTPAEIHRTGTQRTGTHRTGTHDGETVLPVRIPTSRAGSPPIHTRRPPTVLHVDDDLEHEPHEMPGHEYYQGSASPTQSFRVLPSAPRSERPSRRPSGPTPAELDYRRQLQGGSDAVPTIPYLPSEAPQVMHPHPVPESTLAGPTPLSPTRVEPEVPGTQSQAPTIMLVPTAPTAPEEPTGPPRTPPPHVVPDPGAPHRPQEVALTYSGPSDVGYADAERERQDRFEELAHHMEETIGDLQDSEEKRERNYRANEEERERFFVDNERRRDQEAIERRDGIWRELEDRLATLPPVGASPYLSTAPPTGEGAIPMPVPEVAEVPPQTLAPTMPIEADAQSIVETMRTAASMHASEIQEIVRLEREELQREREAAQAERERAQAEQAAEHARMHEEYQAHIRSLEAELQAVRKELEDEKMARASEEAERRERERAEMLEHSDLMRNQLGDLTNLVTEQREELSQKRQVSDERWNIKQQRWEQKDEEDAQTRNMLQQILENQAQMLNDHTQSKQELLEEMRAHQRAALDAIEQQRAAYEGTIREMAEAWRADCEQRKQETIDAVKATANEQVPYNVQGYLDEFSRSLATEVRMLLSEVGKLREDKRNLEYQIGDLLTFKAKFGPGGEYDPSWKPAMTCVPTDAAPAPEAPPPEPEPEVPQPAPSAWRTINTRQPRRSRRSAAAAAPPPPPPAPEPVPTTQSWATWQPNPAFQPSPPIQPVEHLLAPPQGSPGLFGPRSPRDSLRA